ncbi:cupin domain-containing protein [Phreatobacter cathodiphilus]|uniref:Cupin n=1 Tax=Phreatobacter cathodiphilus TaxID=1868589 RepID=A0A2S0N7M9_9HYPH|nr:cupin domain-containing protein [Phreatobacter cathodiphilus]AVO44135.1 cupin [Phreatobacter cathodiphilus]
MPIIDQVKNVARKLMESRPAPDALRDHLRSRKPIARLFRDDGTIPNHPHWPLVIYRAPLDLEAVDTDPAAALDALFAQNGWGRSWRDGIYDFTHYHSQVHEVLGVAIGTAEVEFGGPRGRVYALKPGDVAILPAGTGHRLVSASEDLLVVGAYPDKGKYDEVTDSRQRLDAKARIAACPPPDRDPVYGEATGIVLLWD